MTSSPIRPGYAHHHYLHCFTNPHHHHLQTCCLESSARSPSSMQTLSTSIGEVRCVAWCFFVCTLVLTRVTVLLMTSSPHSVFNHTFHTTTQVQRCSCARVRGCARGPGCQSQADGLHDCSLDERYASPRNPVLAFLHSSSKPQRLFNRFRCGISMHVHTFHYIYPLLLLLLLLLLLTRARPWFVVSFRFVPFSPALPRGGGGGGVGVGDDTRGCLLGRRDLHRIWGA